MAIKNIFGNLNINQLQRLKNELESVEAIKSYNFNRAKVLERQNNLNYEHEYDRLVGELSRANITNNAKRNIEKMKEIIKPSI